MKDHKKPFFSLLSLEHLNISDYLFILAFVIHGLMSLFKETLISNLSIAESDFRSLDSSIFTFTAGCASFVIMVTGKFDLVHFSFRGFSARVIGLLWWIIGWWMAYQSFF
jgi:hypothetical protein